MSKSEPYVKTETAIPVGSSELLAAVVRKDRNLICEAIGNELNRLSEQDDWIKEKMKRLWEVRAAILRDSERASS